VTRDTFGSSSLDEGSALRRDLYLTTQHSQKTDIHAPGGIRTRNSSNRAAADPRLRLCGHWDRRIRTLLRPAVWSHCLNACGILICESLVRVLRGVVFVVCLLSRKHRVILQQKLIIKTVIDPSVYCRFGSGALYQCSVVVSAILSGTGVPSE
jgi:hypothetical protein